MDPDEIIKIIKLQKEIAKKAMSLKGRRATDKPERHDLLFKQNMFISMTDMEADDRAHVRTSIVHAPYPPSRVSLSQLKPILLTDLRLETHHEGCVIFLRAIAMASRTVGVMTIVEDTSTAVDRLSIYNASPDTDPQDILRRNQVYAVKEPYYKATIDGGYSIRVDHPSDLVLILEDHPLMPRVFAPRLIECVSAKAYKDQGNDHYKAKAYQLAIDSYGRGIRACAGEEQDLQADLYRNKAQANLLLGRYECATRDANRSVELLSSGGAEADALNCKALYRAGRALYALRRFSEAQDLYEQALKCSPSDDDAFKALDEVKKRIVEATTGVYNMNSLIALNQTHPRRSNVASYVKDVTVRSAGRRGRGLFAEKDFKAGETIIFEKAFDISLSLDPAAAPQVMIDINTDRGLTGTHANLFYSLVERLRYNSTLARQYLSLYSRDYKPKYNACEVDDCTVIDTFEVLAILESNSFGTAHPTEKEHTGGVGIWLTASYMNHACDANASRLFLGDMMLVKASRDITKGEEIFTSYIAMDIGYADAQKKLQSTWGFKCACVVCTAESMTTAVHRDRRRALLRELMALVKANPHSPHKTIGQRVTRQAEVIYAKVVETYSPALCKGLPRLDLVEPSLWIATSYTTRNDVVRTKPACLEVLRNCGVFVTINKDEVAIDRRHAIGSHSYSIVDSAVHLMQAHEVEGKKAISAQFRSFAHSMWLLMHPTLKGFTKRYGNE